MRKIVALQGWPGSGKSTLSAKWLAEDPERRSRVSRDDLRASLFNSEGVLTPDQESVVTKVLNAQIVALLKADRDIMIDATNLNSKFLRQLFEFCKKNGATSFETIQVKTSVEDCINWDEFRRRNGGRFVGPPAILGLAKRFPQKNWPTINWTIHDAQPKVKQYTGTPGKPKAWIVDIDGTLAKMVDRGPYDTSRYHTDAINEPIQHIVHVLGNEDFILITSGRSEDFRDVTAKWLSDNGVLFDHLIMRKSGDVRNDAIVKEELFWEHIAPNFDVQGCLDDRDRVVEKWRAMGLTCLQVAPGDF